MVTFTAGLGGAGDVRDTDKLVTALQDFNQTSVDTVTLSIGGTAITSTAAELNILDGVGATAGEINNAADVSARVQALTASGAVTAGIQLLELNHVSVIIAATIADPLLHQGILIVKDISATGTTAHTCTITGGTWDGTNTIITLNALNECIMVYIDSAGDGTIIENVGGVALS